MTTNQDPVDVFALPPHQVARGEPEPVVFVVIPMYRVEPHVRDVIASIPDWVAGIVAVDDASPDRSAEEALAAADPRLSLIRHTVNRGVGGAMLSGYAKSVELGATIMVKMDGDGQMAPEFLSPLIRPILRGRADYAKGNRFVQYEALLHMPLIRRWGNLGLSFLTKLASGYWNIFDPTNGYTAISSRVFTELSRERIHSRYFFESSLLIELNILRAVVVDVSMPARYLDNVSSLSITRTLREFPSLLLKGLARRVWLQYFVMDFSIGSVYLVSGTLLVLWGLVFGGLRWIHSSQSHMPATTGTVMLAAIPVILGFQLLLSAVAYDMQNTPDAPVSRS